MVGNVIISLFRFFSLRHQTPQDTRATHTGPEYRAPGTYYLQHISGAAHLLQPVPESEIIYLWYALLIDAHPFGRLFPFT